MSSAVELAEIAAEQGLVGRDIDDFVGFMLLFDQGGHPNYAREWADKFVLGPKRYLDEDKHWMLAAVNREKYGGKGAV